MRLLVLGTGPFAVPTLRRLHADARHEVIRVVTRPPRGRRSAPAPMAEESRALGIPLWQPDTVNSDSARSEITDCAADLLVVCDYGEILKPATLATTPLGGINLHGSLLPKYRGAAPVQWALLQGETETGNTVIQMTPGLDAGPCLGVQRVAIDPEETAGELEARLAELGADLVSQVIEKLQRGDASPVEQQAGAATKAPRLAKEHGAVDWSRSAQEIKNLVRALQPWPRAFSFWLREAGQPVRMIIHRVQISRLANPAAQPGVVLANDGRLAVAAGEGVVELLEVQPAGKRSMTAAELLRGNAIRVGDRFGPEE